MEYKMENFSVGDTVKSPRSLWYGDIGTISGIVDNLIHVIFPETDKHYGYQQTFVDGKGLIKVNGI